MESTYHSFPANELRRQLKKLKASLETCEVSQIKAHCDEITKIAKELRTRGLKVNL